MNQDLDFFKESDTSLGVFYPVHYIVAGYANLADAEAAAAAFRRNGAPKDDVHAVEGDLVMRQIESRHGANWLEHAESKLVEFVGTETGFVHQDADLAHAGGAFLFAYAPDDEHMATARRVFAQHGPRYARRYLKVAIEHIVENPAAP